MELSRITLPARGIGAHRGASETHPENTLPALREAVALGAHLVEVDLRLSRDGEVVLMHDATVDRTTNGHGRVDELTWAEIRRLDAGRWKDVRFREERVPLLQDALEELPANVWVTLHLKGGGAELARHVTRILVETGRLHQAILACGPTAAAAARAISPRVSICNDHRPRDVEAYVRDTVELDAEFGQLKGELPSSFDAVWELRRNGVRINYCCTNDPGEVWQLFRNGVDFVLVDDVERMMRLARRLGIPPLEPVFP